MSSASTGKDDKIDGSKEADTSGEVSVPDMSLLDITDGDNGRGIAKVKFIDDIEAFSNSFQPSASSELLIGAYSELHAKYKNVEMNLNQKHEHLRKKVPELEKSLSLLKSLKKKKDEEEEPGLVRYSLADNIYGKAEVDYSVGKVNLWLGANVMLEYTYQEAIEFLTKKFDESNSQLERTKEDLAFVRDQIVTSEVNMSRIFNWDVRRKRNNELTPAAS